MSDNYDDIKHLSRPEYDDLYPMSMHDRAAQFSPFAALVGYDAAVEETARLTDNRNVMTEDEIHNLNTNLNRLLDNIDECPEIRVVYFIPDDKKEGGMYSEKTGVVRIYDSYANELVFTDGERIAVEDMYDLVFENDKSYGLKE